MIKTPLVLIGHWKLFYVLQEKKCTGTIIHTSIHPSLTLCGSVQSGQHTVDLANVTSVSVFYHRHGRKHLETDRRRLQSAVRSAGEARVRRPGLLAGQPGWK